MWFMVVYKNNNIPLGIQQVQQQYAMTNKDICCDAYARNKIGMFNAMWMRQEMRREMQEEKSQFFKKVPRRKKLIPMARALQQQIVYPGRTSPWRTSTSSLSCASASLSYSSPEHSCWYPDQPVESSKEKA